MAVGKWTISFNLKINFHTISMVTLRHVAQVFLKLYLVVLKVDRICSSFLT